MGQCFRIRDMRNWGQYPRNPGGVKMSHTGHSHSSIHLRDPDQTPVSTPQEYGLNVTQLEWVGGPKILK